MNKIIKHLKENWISHGFETLVVTVGILGAFTLNNWNEGRKTIEKERSLLIQLKKNLNDNLIQLNDDFRTYEKKVNSIGIVVEHLRKGYPNNDSLAPHFFEPYTPGTTMLTSSAYETLKSIGLDLIQSDELREDCIDLYEITYPHLQIQIGQTLNNWEVEMIVPYYSNNFSSDHSLGLIPNDYDLLLTDKKFINILTARDDYFRYILTVLVDIKSKTQEVIDQLDDYLQSED